MLVDQQCIFLFYLNFSLPKPTFLEIKIHSRQVYYQCEWLYLWAKLFCVWMNAIFTDTYKITYRDPSVKKIILLEQSGKTYVLLLLLFALISQSCAMITKRCSLGSLQHVSFLLTLHKDCGLAAGWPWLCWDGLDWAGLSGLHLFSHSETQMEEGGTMWKNLENKSRKALSQIQ